MYNQEALFLFFLSYLTGSDLSFFFFPSDVSYAVFLLLFTAHKLGGDALQF